MASSSFSSSSSSNRKASRRSSGSSSPIQCLKYSKRVALRSVVGRHDSGLGLAGERAVVGGWVNSGDVVKAKRASRPRQPVEETTGLTCTEVLMSRVPLIRCIARLITGGVDKASPFSSKIAERTALVRINDGSCLPDFQIVFDSSLCPLEEVTVVGACVLVEGKIEQVEGTGGGHNHIVQLRVEKVLHIGAVESERYPLSNVQLSSSFVRDYPHLAARTTAAASAARVRSELVHAMHAFFQSNGFIHVNTPIITTTRAGDPSKMFRVTRSIRKSHDSRITPEVVRAAIKEKAKQVEALKRTESNKEALEAAEQDLQNANELAGQLERQRGSSDNDFFQYPAYLSPCHTLHLETFACALSSVYTFSPVFRAESLEHEKRRLAEMWTIDAELAFSELEDAISCAVDCLKSLCSAVLKHCSDELKFLSTPADDATIDRVESALSSPWQKLSYTEAVKTLLQATDKSFEAKVEWGLPLSDQHLSYLADDFYKKPVIIYEYPKSLKPFYARLQEDGKTVSAFDIVLPKVGIVTCGAQKEERMENLTSRIKESGLPHEQMEWYLDTRRHGTVKHSGFGMDLERLVMFVTGLQDILDVIPFSRTKGDANVET